ncbi:hypothetical protein FRC08_007828 [Ceratobasidium sp. 394]|nr:hypothetical protein FRC08_007828 [Ceratobasidium sp. 394]
MTTESHKALRSWDIQALICAHLDDNPDLARLARTSQSWFSPAISHLWRRRDYVCFLDLLELIPGTVRKEGARWHSNDKIPNEFAISMFDRLFLYTPWITSIYAVLEKTSQAPPSSEQVNALHAVFGFMSMRIVFPRLQEVVVDINNYQALHVAGATWLFLLVSPSITRFQLALDHVVDEPEIPMYVRVIEVFSGTVLGTCSELQELELHFSPRALGDIERESPINWSYIPPQLHLNALHLSSHLLEKNWITWISQLPQLQSLDIAGKGTSVNVWDHLDSYSSSHAFPVLSNIRLCDVTFDLFTVLWQPVVVHRLTRATLLWSKPIISNQDVHTMTNMIATRAPNLTALILHPCLSDGYGPLSMRILSSLPLVYLDLDGLHDYELDFSNDLGTFGIFWPRLESLSLDGVEIDYLGLLRISILFPNLRKLGIKLPDYPPDVEIDIPSHPLTSEWPPHQLILSPSEVFYGGWRFEADELENLGLILAMAWPNMVLEIYRPDGICQRELVIIRESLKRHSARILNSSGQ